MDMASFFMCVFTADPSGNGP